MLLTCNLDHAEEHMAMAVIVGAPVGGVGSRIAGR